MGNKVLSIEVGTKITKVVEMSKNKIFKCFAFDTPEGAVNDGVVYVKEEFKYAFELACDQNSVKTKKVVFSFLSSRIANREVMIPAIKKKKIGGLVRANASEYFPVDISKYRLCYNIMEEIGDIKKGEGQLKIAVLAIPNEIIDSYYELAADWGVQIVSMDYSGNSLYQVSQSAFSTGTNLLVKLEEESSLLTVLSQGNIVLQRSITYGISEAVDKLRSFESFGENLSFSDAVTIMRRKKCILNQLGENDQFSYESEEIKNIPDEMFLAMEDITNSISDLIRNIARIIDYHNSRNSNIPIESIVLVGLGADLNGLSNLLNMELEIKTFLLNRLSSTVLSKSVAKDTELSFAQYVTCIGALLKPVVIIGEISRKFSVGTVRKKAVGANEGLEEPGVIEELKESGESYKVQIIVFGFCIVVAAGIIGYPMIKKSSYENTKNNLEVQIDNLQEAQNIYNSYEEELTNYTELETLYGTTETSNEDLSEFFKDLEDNLPSDINVISLTAEESGVEMVIHTSSFAKAAKTLVQLRNLDSLSDVDTLSIETVNSETEETILEFTVNCTYAATDQTTVAVIEDEAQKE